MNYIPPRRSDGTLEQTRIKQPWPKDRLFRILSLDGGGIRGLFGAAYLAEIERKYLGGESIAQHFDMVADTSTGGGIALGLATGSWRPKSRRSTRRRQAFRSRARLRDRVSALGTQEPYCFLSVM